MVSMLCPEPKVIKECHPKEGAEGAEQLLNQLARFALDINLFLLGVHTKPTVLREGDSTLHKCTVQFPLLCTQKYTFSFEQLLIARVKLNE
jgi:hypothetical protein